MKSLNKEIISLWLGILVSLGLVFGTQGFAAYPAISFSGNTNDFITNVTLNTIDRDSVAEGGAYVDTGLSTNVTPGQTYQLSVTINPEFDKISAFIDWNQNDAVDRATEEIIIKGDSVPPPNANFPYTVNVTVPPNATLGAATMRIVVAFLDSDATPVPAEGATGVPGEAEDYTLNVSNNGSTDPVITANAGANGTITPSGAVVVTNGNNQTFQIRPSAGFFINELLIDGAPVAVPTPASFDYTFNTVVANHTISATFGAVLNRSVTATVGSAPANGRISPAGLVQVPNGGSQTFFMLADPGFQVSDVEVNGGSVGAVSTYTFTNLTADATIEAFFTNVADSHPAISSSNFSNEWITNVSFGTIDNNSNAEGYGSFIDQSTEVQPGGDYPIAITIKAVADENIDVYIDWDNSNTFEPTEKTTIASFVNTNGPHYGTITVPPGVTVPSSVRMRVVLSFFNDTVSSGDIAPTPADGGEAEDYTLNIVAADPAVNSSATPTDGSGGTVSANGISAPPARTYNLNAGDNLNFTVTPVNNPPNSVYIIKDFRVDGVTLPDDPFPTTYNFTNVTVTRTIHVDFSLLPTYTITATAGPNGTITPGTVEVEEGGSQTFTMTPAPGYEVSSVDVDGTNVGAVSTYTFENITMDHTIVANFIRSPFKWHMFLPAIYPQPGS